MELIERKNEKIKEIEKSTIEAINEYTIDSVKVVEKVMNKFCVITAPQMDIDTTSHFLTIRSGGTGGGSSIKPGNIWLNWKKLLIDGAESVLTVAGTIAIPWLWPLAGLVIWNKLWSSLKIKIDERHAMVLWAMWQNRNENNFLQNDGLLDIINKEIKKYNRPKMNKKELIPLLNDLENMKCIEKTDENKWWLREWVKTTYK